MPYPPCLYCRGTTTAPTAEHVLQDGFGATLTLDEDVCGTCNTQRLSPLDTELLRYARIYAFANHPDVSANRTILQDGHCVYFDDESEIWISTRLDKDVRPVVFPQIVFPGENKLRVTMDAIADSDWSAKLEQIKSELSAPENLRLKRVLIPGMSPKMQPAIVRSGRNRYAIRAADDRDAAALEARVMSGAVMTEATREDAEDPKPRAVHPRIEERIQLDFGKIERAIAKTALNFVCAAEGRGVAMRAAFDPLREFVLREYDAARAGFVHLVHRDTEQDLLDMATRFCREGTHTLVLSRAEGFPMVFLFLSQVPFAVVRLTGTPAPEALPPDALDVGLLSYRSAGHKIVRLIDDPIGFGRLFFPTGY